MDIYKTYFIDFCSFMYTCLMPFYRMYCLITVWGLSIFYLY